MDIAQTIALTMGVAWASGINLYAAILMLGVMGATGNMVLPAELQILSDPMVLAAAGFMYFVEFFTDKVPGIDSGWDSISTFIRIPAGAILAAGIAGGTLTAGTHATKAGSRILINTSPEPVSNWFASVGEDVAVILGLWTALYHPVLFIVLLILFILFMIWALPKLWRGIRKLFGFIGRKLGNHTATETQDKLPPPASTPDTRP
jgi:hypothetical protein